MAAVAQCTRESFSVASLTRENPLRIRHATLEMGVAKPQRPR